MKFYMEQDIILRYCHINFEENPLSNFCYKIQDIFKGRLKLSDRFTSKTDTFKLGTLSQSISVSTAVKARQ